MLLPSHMAGLSEVVVAQVGTGEPCEGHQHPRECLTNTSPGTNTTQTFAVLAALKVFKVI